MSTLGKVLVVLVTLSMLGWIFLASLVADHHANWGQLVNERKAEIAKIEPLLPPLQEKIDRDLAAASLAQVSLDRSRRNFRGEFAMVQRDQSETKETLSRYNLQNTLVQTEVTKAKARADVRAQEKASLERQIAEEEARVATLIADTNKLRDQFDSLTRNFLATTAENKSYLERLQKSGTANTKPRTRLGSLIR